MRIKLLRKIKDRTAKADGPLSAVRNIHNIKQSMQQRLIKQEEFTPLAKNKENNNSYTFVMGARPTNA